MQSARADSSLEQLHGPGEKAVEGAGEGLPPTVGLSSLHLLANPATLRSQHSAKGVGRFGHN